MVKQYILAILLLASLSLGLSVWAHGEVIIDAASPSQVSGSAIITAYKYNPDGSLNTDVRVHYKVVSTNQGKVFDSYLLEPFYGTGFIWIIDPKFNADFLLYASVSRQETADVSIYVEFFNGEGRSIFTEARTLHPGGRSVWSSAQYVCPQNNPYATNMRPC